MKKKEATCENIDEYLTELLIIVCLILFCLIFWLKKMQQQLNISLVK